MVLQRLLLIFEEMHSSSVFHLWGHCWSCNFKGMLSNPIQRVLGKSPPFGRGFMLLLLWHILHFSISPSTTEQKSSAEFLDEKLCLSNVTDVTGGICRGWSLAIRGLVLGGDVSRAMSSMTCIPWSDERKYLSASWVYADCLRLLRRRANALMMSGS